MKIRMCAGHLPCCSHILSLPFHCPLLLPILLCQLASAGVQSGELLVEKDWKGREEPGATSSYFNDFSGRSVALSRSWPSSSQVVLLAVVPSTTEQPSLFGFSSHLMALASEFWKSFLLLPLLSDSWLTNGENKSPNWDYSANFNRYLYLKSLVQSTAYRNYSLNAIII